MYRPHVNAAKTGSERKTGVANPSKAPPPHYPVYSWSARSPNSRLVYIRDIATAESVLSEPLEGPLGFDLEWKPNFVKGQVENPVALVQLASVDKILLIQVSAMPAFPQKLREILQDLTVVKAGVSIHNDCKKLWFDYGVSVSNCVDLSLLARTVDNARWKGGYAQSIGLARLCETYFELTLPKGKVQRSNWEQLLSPIQQEYAANDGHSGLSLYMHLSMMISALSPRPLPSYYSFDLTNGLPFQPSSSLLPVSQRMMWRPLNPFYDPGPPPERPVKASREQAAGSTKTGSSSATFATPNASTILSPRQSDTVGSTRNQSHDSNRGGFPTRGRRPRYRQQGGMSNNSRGNRYGGSSNHRPQPDDRGVLG